MSSSRHDIKRLLDLYCGLPHTAARRPSAADRRLAAQLCDQDISLDLIEAAFLLAIARRNCRSSQDQPLPPIRSLAYFLPVVEELRLQPPHPDYLRFLRSRAGDQMIQISTDSHER
jgi:hypothetical protein